MSASSSRKSVYSSTRLWTCSPNTCPVFLLYGNERQSGLSASSPYAGSMVASSLSSNRDRHRHIDGCTGSNLHIKPRLHNVLVSNRRVRVMELPCSLLVAVGCTDLRYHQQYDWYKFSDEQFFLSRYHREPVCFWF